MAFVNDLKDKINKPPVIDDEYDIADEIRNDPKYALVISKLRELTIKREDILRVLRKIELDIDACLVLISMGKEKDDIDKRGGDNEA